jgi:hypothetical protein
VRCPTPGGRVKGTLALVGQALPFVGKAIAVISRVLAHVRLVLALFGSEIAPISRADARLGIDPGPSPFGRLALMGRMLSLQLTGARVEPLGLPVQRGHLTMDVSEPRITVLVDQLLAALSRRALRAGLLACTIA